MDGTIKGRRFVKMSFPKGFLWGGAFEKNGIDYSYITEEDKKIIKEGVVDMYISRLWDRQLMTVYLLSAIPHGALLTSFLLVLASMLSVMALSMLTAMMMVLVSSLEAVRIPSSGTRR